MSELDNLRAALSKISEIAGAAAGNGGNTGSESFDSEAIGVCVPKALPKDLQVRAAKTATDLNPVNAPVFGLMPDDESLARLISDPLRIAVVTSKYWGPSQRRLTVSFLDSTPVDLKN